MRPDFLDRYSRSDSVIHRLPAAVKLAVAFALVVLVVLWPAEHPALLAFPAGFLIAVAVLSRIPASFLLWRLILLEPFVLGVALLAVFQPGGWRLVLFLVIRCTLCLAAMILLSNTTPFADLLRVLKRLRVPGLLITTLALMYRYLFVLVDEAQRMKRARASRTFVAKRRRQWPLTNDPPRSGSGRPFGRVICQGWRTSATIVSQLFVRASERAERVYAAMCARGWR